MSDFGGSQGYLQDWELSAMGCAKWPDCHCTSTRCRAAREIRSRRDSTASRDSLSSRLAELERELGEARCEQEQAALHRARARDVHAELVAEVERMRPVYEAAKAWRFARTPNANVWVRVAELEEALDLAIDAARKGET
jgi:hypothetical protein